MSYKKKPGNSCQSQTHAGQESKKLKPGYYCQIINHEFEIDGTNIQHFFVK